MKDYHFEIAIMLDINALKTTFRDILLISCVMLVQMVINTPRPFGVCVFTRLDDHFWAHPKVLNCSDGALKMELSLPPLDQQKKIANILGSLDEKIELNRRMNETLEQLGQALFRHYFVDNSEAKSWDEGILGDIMNITMGQSPPGKSYNNNGDGVVFYQGRADFGLRYPNMRLFTTDPKRFAKVGDVLLTVRAPVGDVNQASERCCIGRGLAAISSRMGAVSFCYYYCRQLKADFLEYNSEGTVFGSINSKQLKALKLKIPPIDLVEKFENEVTVIDKTIKLNSHQIKTLITLRDSLLPKLISGEIEV